MATVADSASHPQANAKQPAAFDLPRVFTDIRMPVGVVAIHKSYETFVVSVTESLGFTLLDWQKTQLAALLASADQGGLRTSSISGPGDSASSSSSLSPQILGSKR